MVDIQKEETLDSCPECSLASQLIVESWERGAIVKHDGLFQICEVETKAGRPNRYHFHFNERP